MLTIIIRDSVVVGCYDETKQATAMGVLESLILQEDIYDAFLEADVHAAQSIEEMCDIIVERDFPIVVYKVLMNTKVEEYPLGW